MFGIGIKDANDLNITKSARFTMFVIFICGNFFFYAYGAFLTSALAVPKLHIPFNSPEEILNTNYRCLGLIFIFPYQLPPKVAYPKKH